MVCVAFVAEWSCYLRTRFAQMAIMDMHPGLTEAVFVTDRYPLGMPG